MTFATRDDISRLEGKLDEINLSLRSFLLIEERQTVQQSQLILLRADMTEHRKEADNKITALKEELMRQSLKLDAWVNRGIGAWSVVVIGWVILEFVLTKKVI